jgi:hypothetical protein
MSTPPVRSEAGEVLRRYLSGSCRTGAQAPLPGAAAAARIARRHTPLASAAGRRPPAAGRTWATTLPAGTPASLTSLPRRPESTEVADLARYVSVVSYGIAIQTAGGATRRRRPGRAEGANRPAGGAVGNEYRPCMPHERGEAGDVLVTDAAASRRRPCTGVEEPEGVEDKAEGADVVLRLTGHSCFRDLRRSRHCGLAEIACDTRSSGWRSISSASTPGSTAPLGPCPVPPWQRFGPLSRSQRAEFRDRHPSGARAFSGVTVRRPGSRRAAPETARPGPAGAAPGIGCGSRPACGPDPSPAVSSDGAARSTCAAPPARRGTPRTRARRRPRTTRPAPRPWWRPSDGHVRSR